MARVQLMASGVRIPYGSFEEAAAITWFMKNRLIEKARLMASLVGPGQNQGSIQALLKAYDEIVFPDEMQERVDYVLKSKQVLERLKKINLYAKPE